MKSAFKASRLRAVSLRVSPFLSEEASAVKLIMSADSRCSESSKLIRVRVEGSTNRLTTVLPRKAGTFLIARSPTALNARAVSSTVTISSAVRDSISSRCLRVQDMVFSAKAQRGEDAKKMFQASRLCVFALIVLLPLSFFQNHLIVFGDYFLIKRGRNIFAHKISLDRQLAMSPVN